MSEFSGPCAVLIAAILLAGPAAARDVAGSHDSPIVSRYTGSTIIGYRHGAYGALDMATGPETYDERAQAPTFTKPKHVEGDLTRIIYVDPAERSPLDVCRN